MSEKIRVMFSVSGQTVGKPIEISDADYIQYMIGQRDGNNMAMALFVSGKFLKNQPVSPDSVSMTKAVGAPMWVFDIDRAIENHEDVKLYQAIDGRSYGISDDGAMPSADLSSLLPPEPEKPNAVDRFIFKYIPQWEKVNSDTRIIWYCFVLSILLLGSAALFAD